MLIPDRLAIGGAILVDQVKSLDWRARGATFICRMPAVVLRETVGKLVTLLRD